MTEPRKRGSGSIFQNGSDTWWIKYYSRGIAMRESSQSTVRADAEKLLKRRLAEVETDTFTPRQNIRVDELIEDLKGNYRDNARKSLSHVEARWSLHLEKFFTKRRASDVSTDLVRRYIDSRRAEDAAPATINRELAVLRAAFNLARKGTPPKVKAAPYIPMLQESNPRTGFLKDAEYSKLAVECGKVGLWLRAMLAVAYNYGWRKGELLGLRVREVDLLERTIRLDPGTTKNGEGRNVPMTEDVFTLLSAAVAGKKPSDYVFTRENGTPIQDFRKTWRNVCEQAGVPDLLVHDLRRTGVRNMRRAGNSETICMKFSGHKTASMFRRYDITDDADMREAIVRLERKRNAETADFGQRTGRVAPKQGSRQIAQVSTASN